MIILMKIFQKKRKKVEIEEDEEYQDFRGSDSGKEEEINEWKGEEKNKIINSKQPEKVIYQLRDESRPKEFFLRNKTNKITTERNNDEPYFDISSDNNLTKKEMNTLTNFKINWDEEEEDEENQSCSSSSLINTEMREESINYDNNYIYVAEGKLINFDDE
ncbi:hypothetical protein Mgra_00007855 [Meloidogyne graminicola]|uniref:Uncharacterized protein n=1 Tax=Meloidogyne graminicola TaxID=189291 RepID=A0A8S9ZHE9_9BILA|nr:hypothetical protein Mgra_00007855 [Meloidogyne graminicola]